MLTLLVPMKDEHYDESTSSFVVPEYYELKLEHSLFSLSKWEEIVEKPFLHAEKTQEETLLYVTQMILNPNPPGEILQRLSNDNLTAINEYVNRKMTATWFRDTDPKSREIITAEVIYYWMVSLNIPFEAQYWHLNKLMTLVKVCNQKNAPEKKLGPKALAERNRELNAQRKAQLGTRG